MSVKASSGLGVYGGEGELGVAPVQPVLDVEEADHDQEEEEGKSALLEGLARESQELGAWRFVSAAKDASPAGGALAAKPSFATTAMGAGS